MTSINNEGEYDNDETDHILNPRLTQDTPLTIDMNDYGIFLFLKKF